MKVDKSKLDVSAIFLCYMAFVGDAGRTAAAFDLDPELVTSLAEREGWSEKVRRISLMSKGEKPGDWERGQNRALNFVQAHRVRQLMDRVLLIFQDKTPAEILEMTSTEGRVGRRNFSARFFADLTQAIEKAQQLSYHALGDTIGEREQRESGDLGANTLSLHASLIAALNNPSMQGREAELLVSEAAASVNSTKPIELEAPSDKPLPPK